MPVSPVTIAANVGASMAQATGQPGQGHLVYAANQGAWWLLYLTSTQSLSAKYSAAFASWTAPTGSPLSLFAAHGSDGRNFAFAYGNLGSTDVLHMAATYPGSVSKHARFTLGTTWTNTDAEATTGAAGHAPAGNAIGIATDGHIAHSQNDGSGDAWAALSTNADTGTWTAGWPGSPTKVYNGETQYTESRAFAPLAAGSMLVANDNGATLHNFTQLYSNTWNGSSWSVSNAVNVLASTVTGTAVANWGMVGRTTSDVHVVALSNNSNAYVHRRYNGSTWGAGDTVPTLTYGTLSGIHLATDGTKVWAHVIDSSGNVQQSVWISGTGWSAWASVCNIVSHTRAYLSGYQTVVGGNIGLAWTENTGASNYDIVGALVPASVPAAGTFTVTPTTIPKNHSGNITLTLAGTSTAWDGTSVFTPSGVANVTKISQNVTSTTAATVVVTTGAGTGTLTITESVTGTATATTTVATATIAVAPLLGGVSTTTAIALTGVNTLWATDTPTFTISGTGNSLGTFVYTNATAATAIATLAATTGTFTITDPSTGATCTFRGVTIFTYDLLDSGIYNQYIQLEGYPAQGTYGGITSWSGQQDCCIRFRGSIEQIEVFAVTHVYTEFRLAIDGIGQTSTLQIDSGGVHAWKLFFTGLNPAVEHEYQLWFGSTSGTHMYCQKVRVLGGTGINTTVLSRRPAVVGIGDSVMSGAGIPTFNSTLAFMADLGMISRFQICNKAIGSRAISSGGGAGTGVVGNLSEYTALSPEPEVIYFLDGVVDVLDSYSTTTFATDYATCIAAFRSAYPSALIICAKIQPYNAVSTLVDPYNVKIANAVTAAADPRIILSSVIHDLTITEGLVGYHPGIVESTEWAAAMKVEIDSLFFIPTSSGSIWSGGYSDSMSGGYES